MAISPASPLTGAAITGLTSPTYTLTSDTPPDINAKQWAVTALGGTQTGVAVHSPDTPFTLTAKRPRILKTPGAKNAVTGMYSSLGLNEYVFITRKFAPVQTGQGGVMVIETRCRIVAGSGLFDPTSVKAAFSCHGGFIANQIQGMCDTALQGLL